VTHCPGDWSLTTPGSPVVHISRTAIREAFSAQYTFSAMLFARLIHTNSSRHDDGLASYVNRTVVLLKEQCIYGNSALLWGTLGLPTVYLGSGSHMSKVWWPRLGTLPLDGLSTVYSESGSHMSKILVATSGNITIRWAVYCLLRIRLSYVQNFGGHVWEHYH